MEVKDELLRRLGRSHLEASEGEVASVKEELEETRREVSDRCRRGRGQGLGQG